jgi:hypothetical protein
MTTELTPEEVEELAKTPAPKVRFDLACPDCDAPLVLLAGKFGRFYGCSTYEESGCKGSHSAHPNGAPKGTPANATVRKLRARVMQHLEEWADKMNHRMGDDAHVDFRPFPELPEGSVGRWGRDECNAALKALGDVFRWDIVGGPEDLWSETDPSEGC